MGSQTPTTPIRLAILEADTPLPQTRAKYSSYGGVFESLFAQAAAPAPLDSVLSISYHHIVGPSAGPYPSLDDVDAILITGSKHNAFEDGEGNWIANLAEFVRKALESETRVKVVGVCFGHQVVARALGVPVGRNAHGWEVSVTEVRLSDKGREVFGKDTLVSVSSVAPPQYVKFCCNVLTIRASENPPNAPRRCGFASGWSRVIGGDGPLSYPGIPDTGQGDNCAGTPRVYGANCQGDIRLEKGDGDLD